MPATGRPADAIVQPDAGVQPHPPAGQAQPVIVFGIFVMAEGRVIAADLAEPVKPEPGVMAMVDPARMPAAAMGGPARAQRRVDRPGAGRGEAALGPGIENGGDRGGLGPGGQRSDDLPDIAGG